MSSQTPLGVGRIARISLGCCYLEGNAKFFARYCGLEPPTTDSSSDTLVLPLAGGPRTVYQRVYEPDHRTKEGLSLGVHVGLSVSAEDLIPMMEEIWHEFPEWEEDGSGDVVAEAEEFLPAHTEVRPGPVGRSWKRTLGRGDYFSDWDGHLFHFVGVSSDRKDGSLVDHKTRDPEDFLHDLANLAESKRLHVSERTQV